LECIYELAYEVSGGLIVNWTQEAFKVATVVKMQRWLCLTGEFLKDQLHCVVCLVYAPNDSSGRPLLWDQLRALKASFSEPLLLMEDFNEVLHPSERRGVLECQGV